MDRVGERINRMKEAQQSGDDVYLLFSVNSQKSYCGLAIVQGDWKEASAGDLEGWLEHEEGAKAFG